MGAISRLITRNPRCAYCSRDGVWNRSGQMVCDKHKREVRSFTKAHPRHSVR
jgi:hypothetical protein